MRMFMMRGTALALSVVLGLSCRVESAAQQAKSAPLPQSEVDRLLAPIALYPDQLLSQILLCAETPAKVPELKAWIAANKTLKGSELQDAATVAGFEPSFVALVLFPQVIDSMAAKMDWTTSLGKAFTNDRKGVFASIQRLRAQAQTAGALKDTPQQDVETKKTESGETVIVIEPANPQIIYVPQYDPQIVYVPTTTTVVIQENNSSDAAVAGLIGFTAGIAIGASMNNSYYYGPYGMRGGGFYMYNDAWDDYYDHREDAREDWQDHREDLVEERGDRARDNQEQRTDRAEGRQDTRSGSQEQRTDRQQTRQENGTTAARQTGTTQPRQTGTTQPRQTGTTQPRQTGTTQPRQTGTTQPRTGTATQPRAQTSTATPARSGATVSDEARGYSGSSQRASPDRSGTKSDAFSGYSSGNSARAASSRGASSRGSSRSGGGGGGRRR